MREEEKRHERRDERVKGGKRDLREKT